MRKQAARRLPRLVQRRCDVYLPTSMCGHRLALQAALAVSLAGATLRAQQPAAPPSAAPAPPITAYRPPVIALVQPSEGGAIYQDKPVVVIRFTAGEAADPIDLSSLVVTVDGNDRTKLFQVAPTEAWGPIAPAQSQQSIPVGAHAVSVRICSMRGACSTAQATISVLPAAASAPAQGEGRSRTQRILDATLNVARRILFP